MKASRYYYAAHLDPAAGNFCQEELISELTKEEAPPSEACSVTETRRIKPGLEDDSADSICHASKRNEFWTSITPTKSKVGAVIPTLGAAGTEGT